MPSVSDILGVLHWIQDNVSGLLRWLQSYKAGYLVVVLIGARITWRIYKSVSSRRANAKRALVPSQPGQAAFGAIQEVVRMLEADPETQWSSANLTALREHLVDTDEVVLRAIAKEEPVHGGLRVAVSGSDRTLEAIRRIVPARAQELNRSLGWEAKAESLADRVVLTVTSTDPKQVARIRGLGFIGLLATGTHNGAHHLAMAKAR
jgi:hypothetical protein